MSEMTPKELKLYKDAYKLLEQGDFVLVYMHTYSLSFPQLGAELVCFPRTLFQGKDGYVDTKVSDPLILTFKEFQALVDDKICADMMNYQYRHEGRVMPMTNMTPKELMTSPGSPGKGKKTRDDEVTPPKIRDGHKYHNVMTAEALYNENAPQLAKIMIDAALGGNIAALKICMDKVLANAKDRPTRVSVPKIETSADAVEALKTIAHEMTSGNITPNEAKEMATIIEMLREGIKQDEDVKQWKEEMKNLNSKVFVEGIE